MPAQVLAVSGDMVDTPDRPASRFPPDQVARVTAEVREVLEEWKVGPGTTVVAGGARGADIIVCEQAHARGARIVLRLAMEPGVFEERSVALAGTDWVERFRRLLAVADVGVLDGGSGDDVFARTNAWIVATAKQLASASPHAIVVWNGREGDGPGGTRDFVRRLDAPRDHIRVIDPTPRA